MCPPLLLDDALLKCANFWATRISTLCGIVIELD